jgi:hypothetical protein
MVYGGTESFAYYRTVAVPRIKPRMVSLRYETRLETMLISIAHRSHSLLHLLILFTRSERSLASFILREIDCRLDRPLPDRFRGTRRKPWWTRSRGIRNPTRELVAVERPSGVIVDLSFSHYFLRILGVFSFVSTTNKPLIPSCFLFAVNLSDSETCRNLSDKLFNVSISNIV